jgi:hypothetical protein
MKELIEALQIFLKYTDEKWPTHCEHDILMIAKVTKDQVSKEDQSRLEELHFFWDENAGCLVSFRFGRA